MIGRLRELRTKQRLPGGKHFQIGCITMLHQQSSASQSRLQGSDLFIQQDSFSLTGLIGNQRIIHLTTGIEQRFAENQAPLLPVAHGQCGIVPPPVLC